MTTNEHIKQWAGDLKIDILSDLRGYLTTTNQYISNHSGLGIPKKYWGHLASFDFINNANWEPHNERGFLPLEYTSHAPGYEATTKYLKNTGTATLSVGDTIILLPMKHQPQAKCRRTDDGSIRGPSSLSIPDSIDRVRDHVMFPATFDKHTYRKQMIPDILTGIVCALIWESNPRGACLAKLGSESELSDFFSMPATACLTPLSPELHEYFAHSLAEILTHYGAIRIFLYAEHSLNFTMANINPPFLTDVNFRNLLSQFEVYTKRVGSASNSAVLPNKKITEIDRRANTLNFRKSFRAFLNAIVNLQKLTDPPIYAKVSDVAGCKTFPHQQFMEVNTVTRTGGITTVNPGSNAENTPPGFFKRYGHPSVRDFPPININRTGQYEHALKEINENILRANSRAGASEFLRLVEGPNNGPDTFDTRMNSQLCLAPRVGKNERGPAIYRNAHTVEEQNLKAIEAYAVTVVADVFNEYFMHTEDDSELAKLYPGNFGNDIDSWTDLFGLASACPGLNAMIGCYLRSYVLKKWGKKVSLEVDPMHRLQEPQYGYLNEDSEKIGGVPEMNPELFSDDRLIRLFANYLFVKESIDWGSATKAQKDKPFFQKVSELVLKLDNLITHCCEIYKRIKPKVVAVCMQSLSNSGSKNIARDGTATIKPSEPFRARLV